MVKSKKTSKVVENTKPTMKDITNRIEIMSQETIMNNLKDCCMDFVDDNGLDSSLVDDLVSLVKAEAFNAVEICLDYVSDQGGYIHDAIAEEKEKYNRIMGNNSETIIPQCEDLADILRNISSPDILFRVKTILGDYIK